MDVSRFRKAQAGGEHERALAEICSGRKRSHWIWYIFPQVAGLGYSEMSRYYAIGSDAEARAYCADALLMGRLREASEALLGCEGTAEDVLGPIDAAKVRSCMTLFLRYTGDGLFARVLDRFYGGEPDQKTLAIIEGEGFKQAQGAHAKEFKAQQTGC